VSPLFRCALAALVLALGLSSPAAAAPGQLVPTFGDGGIKTQQIGDDDARASGVALAPDGKLLTGINLVFADNSPWFGVARFTAAGQLDTATFNPPQGANYVTDVITEASTAFAVGVDGQGRAVMAAAAFADGTVTVRRYTTAGLPDSSAFASPTGKLKLTIPGQDFVIPMGVAIAPDDSIVVVGEAAAGPNRQGFVAFITPAGALDPSFNGGAVKFWPVTDTGGFGGVALQSDGKIVAAGWSRDDAEQEKLTVVRLNRNGSPDSTFAAGATFTGTQRFRSAAADGDSARLTSVAIDRAGRILVAGRQGVTSPLGVRLAAARLTAAGALDHTWAAGAPTPGVQALGAGSDNSTQAAAIVAQPSGAALIAGQAEHNGTTTPLALRLTAAGTPDAGYGNAVPGAPGFVFVPIGDGDAAITGAVRDSDDSFVLAGRANINTPSAHQEIALARLEGQPPKAGLANDAGAAVLGFGDQTVATTSAAKRLTLSNPGEVPIHATRISAPAGFVVNDGNGCATVTLDPGATCAFSVAFAPTASGSASGKITVSSDAADVSVLVSGNGTMPSNLVPSKDVPVDAQVVDPASAPGDLVTIQAKVTSATGRPIVAYLWSTDGPDLNSVTIDTGTIDKLLQRVGLNDTTLWVWAVDDLGHVSDNPARIDIRVPDPICAGDTAPGDLKLGWVHIRSTSCIRPDASGNDFVVPLSNGGASINGLEVSCPASGACGKLTIQHTDASSEPLKPGDTRAFRLRSTEPVELRWPNGQTGPISLGDQTLDFAMPATPATTSAVAHAARDLNLSYATSPPPPIAEPRPEQFLTSIPVGPDTTIGTLDTTGTVSLSVYGPEALGGEPGMKLTANVKVPIPGQSEPTVAPVVQEANAVTGPKTDGKAWEVDLSGVGFLPLLHFETLKLKYAIYVPPEGDTPARTNVFDFQTAVGIDITGWTVAAAGVFSKTFGFERIEFGFHRNEGTGFTGLNLPLGQRSTTGLATRAIPLQLDELGGLFQLQPYMDVGGTVKVLIGEKITVGGTFRYSEAHDGLPWRFLAGATFPVSGLTVTGKVLITGAPQPGVGISGTVGFSVKDLIALEGTVFMYFGYNEATRQVLAEFGLSGSITVLSYNLAGFTAFVNNDVIAGCGNLGSLAGWGAYKFATKATEFGFGDCDNIAKYSLVPELAGLSRSGPRARAAAAKLEVPAGVDWANLELRADQGLARATIEGPGGVTYTVPETSGLTGERGDPIVVLTDPVSHRTVIGLHKPKPGAYRVVAIDGAPLIRAAHIAYGRPTTVKARVSGKGKRRTLRYTIDGPPAKVTFEERAKSAFAVLGTASGARGTIRFRPGDLGPKKRTIVARVTKDGQELPAETVARFTACPPKPKAPRRLKIKLDRRKALAKVRWARDPLAARYDVELRTKSGRRLDISVSKPRLVVPSVYVGDRIKVTVKGVTQFKVSGPARSAKARVTDKQRKDKRRKNKRRNR
jgi:uncharacterized delta-60 repeat protein